MTTTVSCSMPAAIDRARARAIVVGATPRSRTTSPAPDGPMHDVSEVRSIAPTLTPGGFQALLVAVLPPAFGYALRLTRHRADAEDLVQDASLLAFRAAHTFEPGTNFKAWFFRILTRCFWARHRTRRRRPATVDLEDAPELFLYARAAAAGLPGDDPAALLIDRLGSERVAAAIAALPAEYGVVCTLYFMEDFAYHEIASVVGIPVGTVRSRLHRGRRMLRKLLWAAAEEAGIVRAAAREPRRP
jgi:RNA polymerase sigma-70 factor (ECF subfamily)